MNSQQFYTSRVSVWTEFCITNTKNRGEAETIKSSQGVRGLQLKERIYSVFRFHMTLLENAVFYFSKHFFPPVDKIVVKLLCERRVKSWTILFFSWHSTLSWKLDYGWNRIINYNIVEGILYIFNLWLPGMRLSNELLQQTFPTCHNIEDHALVALSTNKCTHILL